MGESGFTTRINIDFSGIKQHKLDEAEKAMRQVGEHWHAEAMKAFTDHTATAGVKNKMDVKVIGKGAAMTVLLTLNDPAAATLHEGRGKNKRWPPKDVIQKWIRRRLGKSADEAERLAFLIQRKIGKEGFFSSRQEAGSRWARIGPGGTFGTQFARGPLEEHGAAGGKWENLVAAAIKDA